MGESLNLQWQKYCHVFCSEVQIFMYIATVSSLSREACMKMISLVVMVTDIIIIIIN